VRENLILVPDTSYIGREKPETYSHIHGALEDPSWIKCRDLQIICYSCSNDLRI